MNLAILAFMQTTQTKQIGEVTVTLTISEHTSILPHEVSVWVDGECTNAREFYSREKAQGYFESEVARVETEEKEWAAFQAAGN